MALLRKERLGWILGFGDLRNKQVSFLGITLFYIHSPSYPVSDLCE
jgi:hypothetical protein